MFNPQLKGSLNVPASKMERLGTEWVLIRVETLHGMMEEVEKILGSGAALVWYTAGKGAGRSLAHMIKKTMDTSDLLRVSRFIVGFYGNCGWGRGEIVSWRPEKGEFIFQVWDNVFAKKDSSNTSSCYFLKGFIEGVLEELIGRRVRTEETKCISKGDECCEFSIIVK